MGVVEHVVTVSGQGDADGIGQFPLDTKLGPMSLEAVMVDLTAVAGSPTGVTLDVNLTDGTITKTPISGQSIGTAAGTVRLAPTEAVLDQGVHIAGQKQSGWWRYNFDLNFSGGSTPTVSGTIVFRWRL